MLSNRAEILAQLPARGSAARVRVVRRASRAWVERLMRIGVLEDYTRIWWDVRPHPKLGTLEIRIADQPTSLERTALLVGLLRESRRRRAGAADRPRRLRPEPVGGRPLRARRGADPSRTARALSRRASWRASCSERSRRSPRRSRSSSAARPAADIVARTVA